MPKEPTIRGLLSNEVEEVLGAKELTITDLLKPEPQPGVAPSIDDLLGEQFRFGGGWPGLISGAGGGYAPTIGQPLKAGMRRLDYEVFTAPVSFAQTVASSLLQRGAIGPIAVPAVGAEAYAAIDPYRKKWEAFVSGVLDKYYGEIEEPTGKYADPAASLKDYFADPKRAYKMVAENAPLMAGFVAATLVNPTFGLLTIAGVEGHDAQAAIDQYESSTGNTVDSQMKITAPLVVGAINAALERIGIMQILRASRIPGILGKVAQGLLATITEGSTEGLQEVTQMLAEKGYNEAHYWDWRRVAEAAYGGTLLGLSGSVASGTAGRVSNVQVEEALNVVDDKSATLREIVEEAPAVIKKEVHDRGFVFAVKEKGKLWEDPNAVSHVDLLERSDIRPEDVTWKGFVTPIGDLIDTAELGTYVSNRPVRRGTEGVNSGEAIAAETGADITYVPGPDEIHRLRQFIASPEFILRTHKKWFRPREIVQKPEALRWSGRIIEGQLIASHSTRVIDDAFIEEVSDMVRRSRVPVIGKIGLVAAEKKIRPAMEELYELTDVNVAAKHVEAQRLIDSSPTYRAANRVIQWFANVRAELIEYKRDIYRRQLNDKVFAAFEEARRPDAVTAEVAKLHNVDKDALEEIVWEYKKLENWGLREFITNIERGTYRVLDSKGTVRAVGVTAKEARRKADDLVKAKELKGKVTISPEFQKSIDPMKPRKGILLGEKNIIDALHTYSYIIRKKMALEPVEIEMEKAFEADKGSIIYPKNVRSLLREQLRDAKGRYSWGDEITDRISRAFGTRPMLFSRGVGVARAATGYNKLGYRPVAALVNFAGGHGHTWTKVGFEYMRKGNAFLRTAEGKRYILEEGPYLGLDFASDAAGRLVTKQSWWNPLKLFGLPEPGIRRLSLAANYLHGKETMGMSDAVAREHAHRALRVQNFTYNTAALPRILRGPGGRLVGQFKTYLVKELEFLATLSGKEWARYLGLQLTMAGPRGLLLMLRSLPILGLLRAFDKIEEWLLGKEKMGAIGLPGVVGIDISFPATFQFAGDRPEDYAGPFLSDVWGLAEVSLAPALRGEKVMMEDVIDWARGVAVIWKYWDNIMQMETTRDGWIRDKAALKQDKDGRVKLGPVGAKRYKISSEWDKMILGLGAPTIAKSKAQIAQRILSRENKVQLANRRKLLDKVVNLIDKNRPVPNELWEELAMLGVRPSATIRRLKMQEMTPQQRAMMREDLIDKARAWEIFED